MSEAKRKRFEVMAGHSSSQDVDHNVTADEFETVLQDKMIFVDKTFFIRYILEDISKNIMFTAPPRFGKTVNITTLRSFFARGPKQQELPDFRKDTVAAAGELQEKYKLFKDCKIYQCNHGENVECPAESSGDFQDCEVKLKFYKHCGQYPVIFLDFGTVGGQTLQRFLNGMRRLLQRAFRDHLYLIEYHEQTQGWVWSDKSMFTKGMLISNFLKYWEDNIISTYWEKADVDQKVAYIEEGFENLYMLLSEFYNTKEIGKKIILIIDEQDAPVLKALFDQSEDLKNIVIIMRDLMRLLIKSEISRLYLHRAVITSMSAIGGIMSVGVNNVDIRPFLNPIHSDYYKCFGFNKAEVEMLVEKNFTFEVPEKRETALKDIKRWYNNYVVEGKDQETYCPLSVKQYVLQKNLQNYWLASVGGQLLDQAFQHEEICNIILPVLESPKDIEITLKDITIDGIESLKNLFSTRSNNIESDHQHLFLRFLVECGFFNITNRRLDANRQEVAWNVRIPNLEVGAQLSRQIHNAILKKAKTKLKPQKIKKLRVAFKNLKINANETYIALANALEDLYSDDYQPIDHFNFQSDLSYILADREDSFFVRSELPIANGVQPRTDLLVICDKKGIILELKRGQKETAFDALEQILDRKYWKALNFVDGKFQDTILIGLHLADGKKVTMRYLENPNHDMDINELLQNSRLIVT